jgi:hypothetical protein
VVSFEEVYFVPPCWQQNFDNGDLRPVKVCDATAFNQFLVLDDYEERDATFALL